jgi:GAF domain-containing protein
MKVIYKNLVVVLSLLFTLSLIGLAYYLYIFPERLANMTHVISLDETTRLAPVMKELYVFSAISLGLGFAAILFSLFSRNGDSESNVVYIEKFKDKKEQADKTSDANSEKEETDTDVIAIKDKLKLEKDTKKKAELALSEIANKVEASQGSVYRAGKEDGKNVITLFASYAFVLPESQTLSYEFGEGLAGQVAKEKKMIVVDDVPEGYINILSGLGESKPASLAICPIMKDEALVGVAEIASFKEFTKAQEIFIQKVLQLLSDALQPKKETAKEE